MATEHRIVRPHPTIPSWADRIGYGLNHAEPPPLPHGHLLGNSFIRMPLQHVRHVVRQNRRELMLIGGDFAHAGMPLRSRHPVARRR